MDNFATHFAGRVRKKIATASVPTSEREACEFFEDCRWSPAAECVACGSSNVFKLGRRGRDGERNRRFLWLCRDCGKQFNVRTGVFAGHTHVSFSKLWRALRLAVTVPHADLTDLMRTELGLPVAMAERLSRFSLDFLSQDDGRATLRPERPAWWRRPARGLVTVVAASTVVAVLVLSIHRSPARRVHAAVENPLVTTFSVGDTQFQLVTEREPGEGDVEFLRRHALVEREMRARFE